MKPTAPLEMTFERVCHDTLPWLISFSLDDSALMLQWCHVVSFCGFSRLLVVGLRRLFCYRYTHHFPWASVLWAREAAPHEHLGSRAATRLPWQGEFVAFNRP